MSRLRFSFRYLSLWKKNRVSSAIAVIPAEAGIRSFIESPAARTVAPKSRIANGDSVQSDRHQGKRS